MMDSSDTMARPRMGTLAIHAGQEPAPGLGAVKTPNSATSPALELPGAGSHMITTDDVHLQADPEGALRH